MEMRVQLMEMRVQLMEMSMLLMEMSVLLMEMSVTQGKNRSSTTTPCSLRDLLSSSSKETLR
jgi:hypothetical protein